MTPFKRKIARVLYYASNITADVSPQWLFRRQRDAVFDRIKDYDRQYLASRLSYYNKLPAQVADAKFDTDIGHIPMSKSIYYYDLKEHARYFPRTLRLNYAFGDVTYVPDRPSFTKSRPIAADNTNSVIMKLEKFRHFYFPADTIPFKDKKPVVVWRGGQHNPGRTELVRGHHDSPLCDVGFTDGADAFRKPFLLPEDQMKFRYIISIEGNDVATNLKWILASNSLCFMTAPVYETWFMEGRLDDGKHYVELRRDYSDLEEKVLHYESHPEEALQIVRNANAYVAQFFDERREQLLSLLVMQKYFVATGQIESDARFAGLID